MSASTFEVLAKSYDQDFSESAIGKLQRKVVWDYSKEKIDPTIFQKVLEINGGTGVDARFLSERGHSVTYSDAAQAMVDRAVQNHGDVVEELLQLDIKELDRMEPESADLIWSNFGGLNCLSPDELREAFEQFFKILTPGGSLLFVIMGRKCWWERFYFRLKGKRKEARRRLGSKGVNFVIDEKVDKIFYYSPDEAKGLAGQAFEYLDSRPVGLFVPPSYLEAFFKRKKILLSFLSLLDRVVGKWSFLSNSADHFLIELRKR